MTAHLQTAIKASLEAGRKIMEVYNTMFSVELKNDNSPLTEADKKANDIINTYLKPTNIPIISEENKQTAYSKRALWTSCWIVDPVDGTKEFIKRNGEFTVNIALVTDGKPIFGVIYVPDSKTLYVGDVLKNKSYKAELSKHKSSIDEVLGAFKIIKPKGAFESKIRIVGSRSHMNQETLDYINKLKKRGKEIEIIATGSSLKFCLVAEGKAEVYPRFGPTMEWDTAAGQAICEAVGVQVISRDTNRPLHYNKDNLLNPFFVVSQ